MIYHPYNILAWQNENVGFGHKKGEWGGQNVMTVLFISENVDNYGWSLTQKLQFVCFSVIIFIEIRKKTYKWVFLHPKKWVSMSPKGGPVSLKDSKTHAWLTHCSHIISTSGYLSCVAGCPLCFNLEKSKQTNSLQNGFPSCTP